MKPAITTILLAALVFSGQGPGAAIFKCRDESGHIVYKDTHCLPPESERPIDARFASSLPLGFPEEDLEYVTRAAIHSQARREAVAAERNNHIRQRNAALQQKRAECLTLREELETLRTQKRRAGTATADAEIALTAEMREACSS